jgi:hypothetical protein
MGAFFTNVQVLCRDQATETVVETIAEALAERLAGGAQLAVARPTDSAWVSVYDQATESQDAQELDLLATMLSEATGCIAVSVLVHDSSILELALFTDGRCIDRWVNIPDYFGKVSKAERARVEGRADLWMPCLAEGRDQEELEQVWRAESAFAEDTLAKIARLFGWNDLACGTGYHYLDELEPENLERLGQDDAKPAVTAPSAKPQLTIQPMMLPGDFTAGEPIRVQLMVANTGGNLRGLRILLSSRAIAEESIEVQGMMAIVGRPSDGRMMAASGPALVNTDPSTVVAEFPKLEVPGGPSQGPDGKASVQKLMAMIESGLNLGVVLNIRQAETFQVTVTVAPIDSFDGAASQVLEIAASG